MNIAIASSNEEILAAFEVFRHLRDLADANAYLERVRALQKGGYVIAVLAEHGSVVAAAGFRIGEKLAWGRHMYIDDLVTAPDSRSMGYGSALMSWLVEYARAHDCGQIHLDSGKERLDAHRFYERSGFEPASLHFKRKL